jgi:hypothetical protein
MRKSVAGVAVGVAALAFAACQVQVTPDGGPYRVAVSGSRMTVSNVSSGGNNRELEFSSTELAETASTECATWTSGTGLAQNGVAFRIAADSGGVDSVTLERDIWDRQFWKFVVVYFHTGSNYPSTRRWDVGPITDLSGYLGKSTTDVFPLRFCASLTTNDVLRFAVAKGADTMPPVGTPGQGGTFALNRSEEPVSGRTGAYVAHVPRGASSVVDDVILDGKPAPPPNM